MTADRPVTAPTAYDEILADYLRTRSEAALYQVSLLSQSFIESGLGPEDIIALHFEALDRILAGYSYREQARANADAQQFLLEVMIAYGVRFKEYLQIKLEESQRDAEARATQERGRAMDAERVGRQKGEILGVIAHELRTPLTAAMGNVDFAKRLLERGQVERIAALLELAHEALNRLSRLSADLVESSRSGPPPLRPERLAVCPVVTQACRWVEATAVAHGIELRYASEEPGFLVRGDTDALLSVFGNLLSNAIRYTPAGGQVTVRWGADDAWVWVEVSDTGIGLGAEAEAHIFEKFYRAPEARRVEPQGLGLGLALVQQIVEAHAGRIAVQSTEGQGSTFRVSLPRLAGEAPLKGTTAG
jgi:signal transduction histidine kinase